MVALEAYGQALELYRAGQDRGNEAATLSNIGNVYARTGDPGRALEYYQQALPISREVGDRAGEAVTRSNIAMIHRDRGDLDTAIHELEQVVDLDHQTSSPNLPKHTATLDQLRRERTQQTTKQP